MFSLLGDRRAVSNILRKNVCADAGRGISGGSGAERRATHALEYCSCEYYMETAEPDTTYFVAIAGRIYRLTQKCI